MGKMMVSELIARLSKEDQAVISSVQGLSYQKFPEVYDKAIAYFKARVGWTIVREHTTEELYPFVFVLNNLLTVKYGS